MARDTDSRGPADSALASVDSDGDGRLRAAVLEQFQACIGVLSIEELTEFWAQLEERFEARRGAIVDEKRREVEEIADSIGMTPEQLLGLAPGGEAPGRPKRKRRKIDMTTKEWWVDPTGENKPSRKWGPPPKWVKAAIDAGTPEADLIKPATWTPPD